MSGSAATVCANFKIALERCVSFEDARGSLEYQELEGMQMARYVAPSWGIKNILTSLTRNAGIRDGHFVPG